MLTSLVLLGAVLLGPVEGAAAEDLSLTVRRLVYQLNAPALAERDAAEAALIQLGPAVLNLLPPPSDRTPAETRLRVERVRQKLQQAMAAAAMQPSTVTLQANAMPLSKVLAAFQQQTGNKIVDYRERFGQQVTDPPLNVRFSSTPFWPALDQLVDQAGLGVYPFGDEKAVCVVGREEGQPLRSGRAKYLGPLRFEATRVEAVRDLRDPAKGSLRLMLEIAWEPRLTPISLQVARDSIQAVDEQGKPIAVDGRQGEIEAPGTPDATAVELQVPLVLPPRETRQIASLKGTLTALVAGKVETFRFTNLDKAKDVQQRIAAATVTLEQVRRNENIWEVRMVVRFDNAGDALASHRNWVFENPAFLQAPNGQELTPEGFETIRQTENEVGVAYAFAVEGPLTGYTFVYKTPGMIFANQFPFEIDGIELP